MTTFTSQADFEESYKTVFRTFRTGKTKPLSYRKWQLKQLWWMIEDNRPQILAALHADLHRSEIESTAFDITGLQKDLYDTINNLEKWTADLIPEAGFIFGTLGKARIRKEPLGVSLIIGSWNFPIIISLQPLVAAIAAGCCAIVKPSDLSINTQNLIAEMVPKYLDPEAYRVVTAGPKEMEYILSYKFNHIFYTGSAKVGKIVAIAAAKYLTPVTLELGGQGPAVVDESADLDLAAKRIASTKFQNAGQICLSVNHVFVPKRIHAELVDKLGYWFDTFLREEKENPEQMVRIINERQFDRLEGLLERTEGKIVYGGSKNREDKYIQPTVVTKVSMSDPLLGEEIFGPILPVIEADVNQAITHINSMEHPLGIYVFGDNKTVDQVIKNTTSGGVTINDVFLHAAVPDAPFGGVGESGVGSYHGRYGILAFSHQRTIVGLPTWLDKVMEYRYPPYTEEKLKKVEKVKANFRRGETQSDQKIKSAGGGKGWWKVGFVVVVAAIAVADRQGLLREWMAKLF